MSLIKEKRSQSKQNEQIQLLTLVSESWTITEIVTKFPCVTRYMVRQSRKLLKEKGLLAMPDSKRGKNLSEETVVLVKQFYCDDEFTRLIPDKTNFISIGKNKHGWKRLILCNLKEHFAQLKSQHPNVNIGFSKFCSLQPTWGTIVSPSGSHSVCVCTIHQNTTLLVNAVKLDVDVHNLVDLIICDRASRECMMHHCSNYPGTNLLHALLLEKLDNDEDNIEDDESQQTITFKQWSTTDRVELVIRTEPVWDHIDLMALHLNKSTEHSNTTTAQSNYLKSLKETLPENDNIVLGDFAFWIIPFLCKTKFKVHIGTTKNAPFILLSFTTASQVKLNPTLYALSLTIWCTMLILWTWSLKKQLLSSRISFYASCPRFTIFVQDNKRIVKTFLTCYHEYDFGVSCLWSFFAKSHGKSPCDGICSTLKWLAARASLQWPMNNQILKPVDFFNFCNDTITSVTLIFLSHEQIEHCRSTMKDCYETAKTVPGTRSFHHFTPLSTSEIGTKRPSEGREFMLKFRFGEPALPVVDAVASQYISCIYNHSPWIGVVTDADPENHDVY